MMKLKVSYMVKPAKPTPSHRLSLSECDQLMPFSHTTTIYFYRPVGDTVNSAIEIMRDALSKALVQFYPLAGRLNWIDGGRFELDCNAVGAQLSEAESEARIDDFEDFRPTPKISELVPYIDYSTPIHEQPLFLVQLTRLRCGGISIGMAISHVVADGQSALQFISYWAKIACGETLDIAPSYDRTFLEGMKSPMHYHHVEFDPPPLLIGQLDDMEERKKETTVAMLKLTKDQVEKLRDNANKGHTKDIIGLNYSRYEAIAGHMWRCACKARGHTNEQPTQLNVTVDCRKRLHPPLPPNYFGNVIFPTTPTIQSGELLSKPLGYASSKIREAVEKMSDEYVRSAIEFLRSQSDLDHLRSYFHTVGCTKGIFLGNPNITFTSWLNLPIYDANFGWGKPIYVGPASMSIDGESLVLPNQEDNGSLIVALGLQVAYMEDFKKFFYEDLLI